MLLELRMMAKAQRLPKVAQALEYAFYEAFSCANQAVIPLTELEKITRLTQMAAELEKSQPVQET